MTPPSGYEVATNEGPVTANMAGKEPTDWLSSPLAGEDGYYYTRTVRLLMHEKKRKLKTIQGALAGMKN
jgi:hypothetical protein